MRVAIALAALAAVAGGCSSNPKLLSVSPTTLCANEDNTVTLTGSDLHPKKVEIGLSGDMGSVPFVAAASVSGSGSTAMATFSANTLTPSDTPYDVVVTNSDGSKTTLPAAVTVVPGISIAAVDPGSVYNGVDFPTSVYGTGMGAVKTIQISMGGAPGIDLTGVTAVNKNRADGVVPMGTPPGTYDVTVVDQNGCTATLASALVVTDQVTVSVCGIDPPFGYDMDNTDVVITATADGKAGSATCGGKTGTFVSSPRAWLNVGGTLKQLSNVAFVSSGSVTATVPKGLTDGGPYDLILQNPDGSVGLLAGAFTVVNKPVPVITSVSPTQIKDTATVQLKIMGSNFRDPVKVEVYNPYPGNGLTPVALTQLPNATVNATGTEVDVSFTPSTYSIAAGYTLLLRVTDTDQSTYGEYSALYIVLSSGKPGNWTDLSATAPLPKVTMRGAGAAGQTTLAAHNLYLVGGDSGGATPTPYAQTQIASFDKYGNLGSWTVGHNKLASPRTMLGAIAAPGPGGIGGFVYLVGGYDGTAPVKTVSRAQILLPSGAPVTADPDVTLDGTLTRGTWFYKVSAVLNSSDPTNPSGETLPSEEVAAHTVDGSKVTLTWSAVTNAASYRVYRTAMVNGVSQTEVLLQDAVMGTTFTDDGTATPGADTPFVQGELGVWVDMAPLAQARRYLGVAMAHDPTGAPYLYAIGGDNDTGYASTIAGAATVYNTYEHAALMSDGTLGTWTEETGNAMTQHRSRLGAAVADQSSAPAKITDSTAYVYAIGGSDPAVATNAVTESYEAALVGANGVLGTWTTAASGYSSTFQMMGVATLVQSDALFAIGGTTSAGATQANPASSSVDTTGTLPNFGQLSADSALAHDVAAQLISTYGSLVVSGAHIYMLGGSADVTTGLDTVWSNTF